MAEPSEKPPTSKRKATELSSDDIWKLVKDRVSEHFLVLRWVTIGVGVVVSVFVGALVALFAVEEIRTAIVKRWVVDVDAKIDRFFEEHRSRLFALEKQIEAYLEKVVAYSYSTDFQLSGTSGPKYHNLPFYKTNRDSADLRCRAFYPVTLVKNRILLTFNGQAKTPYYIERRSDANVVDVQFVLPKDNSTLFDLGTSPSANQNISFTIDRSIPYEGIISIRCTMQIIGPARLEESR
ncbi:MAG: hypothetical protein QOJ84_1087 [Bradyrhizobium sp.]|jgi:hypothetical protein|nr:hypothetical protein [Bradyrhizobium sp.]